MHQTIAENVNLCYNTHKVIKTSQFLQHARYSASLSACFGDQINNMVANAAGRKESCDYE